MVFICNPRHIISVKKSETFRYERWIVEWINIFMGFNMKVKPLRHRGKFARHYRLQLCLQMISAREWQILRIWVVKQICIRVSARWFLWTDGQNDACAKWKQTLTSLRGRDLKFSDGNVSHLRQRWMLNIYRCWARSAAANIAFTSDEDQFYL